MAPGLPLLILPVAVAVAILVFAGGRGVSVLKKQGVAWGLTTLMIVAAIGIGFAKNSAGSLTPDIQHNSAAYIRDDAGVLSAATEKVLADRNGRLLDRYDVAIGVITGSRNYGPDDLVDYAYKVAEQMDLRDYDMLVVMDIRSGEYGIIQGEALANDFTNDDCSRYVRNYMEQDFERGNYDAAVLSVTEMLEAWYGSYFG